MYMKKIQNFKCDIYGQGCDEKYILKKHIAAVHKNQRIYKCKLCDETFRSFGSKKLHLIAAHWKKEKHEQTKN